MRVIGQKVGVLARQIVMMRAGIDTRILSPYGCR